MALDGLLPEGTATLTPFPGTRSREIRKNRAKTGRSGCPKESDRDGHSIGESEANADHSRRAHNNSVPRV